MTIEGLVDATVMEHLSLYGCIKRMDSFAIHMLKTSEHPLMRFRRDWMRREALKQCLDATARQTKMNEELKNVPQPRSASIRQEACVDPWLVGDMRQRHKTEWQDPDFRKFVKREDPAMFPKRDIT